MPLERHSLSASAAHIATAATAAAATADVAAATAATSTAATATTAASAVAAVAAASVAATTAVASPGLLLPSTLSPQRLSLVSNCLVVMRAGAFVVVVVGGGGVFGHGPSRRRPALTALAVRSQRCTSGLVTNFAGCGGTCVGIRGERMGEVPCGCWVVRRRGGMSHAWHGTLRTRVGRAPRGGRNLTRREEPRGVGREERSLGGEEAEWCRDQPL